MHPFVTLEKAVGAVFFYGIGDKTSEVLVLTWGGIGADFPIPVIKSFGFRGVIGA